jgi:hypothetical protein
MKSWLNASEDDFKTFESISAVFLNHQYLLDHFFEEKSPRIRLHSEKMIKIAQEQFTDEEVVLIKVALDIWSGSGKAYIWEVIEVLDKHDFINVLNGLVIAKKNRSIVWPL